MGGFGLLRAIPIVLLLLFGGMVLAVVVAVRRHQARHELRYWDGQQWTEHVSDRGTQGVDPL